uniref:Uncharacterized protein n=1 Tax=Anas platyrhynchos platyrhynchos TaxID=8840 RepID=A0A493SU51_ANAPP
MAAGPGSGSGGAPSEAEAAHLCRSLEVGTVMTLFYSKKSQRPERKTFQVKLETRQVTWSRGSEKTEGAAGAGQERQGRGFPASWLGGDTRSPSAPRSCLRWGGEKREEKIKIKTLKKK